MSITTNVTYESSNGMALLVVGNEIDDIKADMARASETGDCTYLLGGQVWGEAAVSGLERLLATKLAEFAQLRATNQP